MLSQNFQRLSKKKIEVLCVSLLFFIAIIPRIFLYHTEFFRSPDPIEYINVAKNINSGKGLTQSIKWFFFDTSPVITSALKGRPILTSLIFSALLRIHNDVYFLQAFELVLVSINIILFYLLARHFFSSKVSFLAAFIAAINPNVLITNRLILSEPICVFFVLVFFIIFYNMKKNAVRYLLLGFISGLAYLTRFEGFLLLLTLFLLEVKNYKLILVSLISFVAVTLPYFLLNFQVNHNPFYSYNSYHLQVRSFSEGMWDGFGKTFPTSASFIKNNLFWIIIAVKNLFIYNIKSIIGISFLSFLSLIYFLQFKDIIKKFKALLLFSLLYLISLSIVWSGYTEPERHFTIIYMLILLPVFVILKKPSLTPLLSWIAIVLFSTTIALYMILDVHRLVWAKTVEPHMDNWGVGDEKNIFEWIKKHTDHQSIIASENPWRTYLFTDRPSIMLPTLTSVNRIKKFVKEYHVEYVIDQYSEKNIYKKSATVVFKDNGKGIYCYISCRSF